jgi:ribosomal protein L11 methyltransferase
MALTRVDILADKGTEEVLDVDFYSQSGGVWIEDHADGVRITCYPANPDRFVAYVRESGLTIRGLTTVEEAKKDYVALVRQYFTPVKIGDLTILPPWRRPPKKGRAIVIEPGMAFGTGRHESTKLMVRMMDTIPIEARKVLDIGSGSGILAVNAALLGASLIAAIDHDPLAAEAAKKSCGFNRSGGILLACGDIAAIKGVFDVVLANLDFATFSQRAAEIVRKVAPSGYLVISGIEDQFGDEAPRLFRPLSPLTHRRMKGWHGFVFRVDSAR